MFCILLYAGLGHMQMSLQIRVSLPDGEEGGCCEASCPQEPIQGMWDLLSCIQSTVLSQKVSNEALHLLTFISLEPLSSRQGSDSKASYTPKCLRA